MKKIILASNNPGKVTEFKQMLADYDVEVLSLIDINYPEDIEETGTTFIQNARIKAQAIAAQHSDAIVVADDSGLEVDALNGEPGVYSARYAGLKATADANIDKLLVSLQLVEPEKRSARFVCVLVVLNANQEYVARGTCEGQITTVRRGNAGFGYDPIFYVPELKKTMAEMDDDEKNAISHRGQAFTQLLPILTNQLQIPKLPHR